jgi:hypothetical protein
VPGNPCGSSRDGNGSWDLDGNVCFTVFYFRERIGRLGCLGLCLHTHLPLSGRMDELFQDQETRLHGNTAASR